jgi:hypothetical protein
MAGIGVGFALGHSGGDWEMKLFLESGKVLDNPSVQQFEAAVRSERFAILSDSKDCLTYMQFLRKPRLPLQFALEYQEDSIDGHYKAVGTDLTVESIVNALRKYAAGDQSWKGDFKWEQMKLR